MNYVTIEPDDIRLYATIIANMGSGSKRLDVRGTKLILTPLGLQVARDMPGFPNRVIYNDKLNELADAADKVGGKVIITDRCQGVVW